MVADIVSIMSMFPISLPFHTYRHAAAGKSGSSQENPQPFVPSRWNNARAKVFGGADKKPAPLARLSIDRDETVPADLSATRPW
jgi:hypothetical protein